MSSFSLRLIGLLIGIGSGLLSLTIIFGLAHSTCTFLILVMISSSTWNPLDSPIAYQDVMLTILIIQTIAIVAR